ncbi:hypothetical protein BU26DRAFT_487481 [Trematosphaeria pertusa]|uniref:Bet v1-like protein n=1 Tax=Trematosphaeria pertusa TaxID=390896 RepID=A0A6A6IB17_9PLEO|nr:uncharacterized protein BU26DRAFT_487481 [Trematosphaeria pertusa]KAF2247765.1 hypothetical protein BU26DRAFT_487481 [Trematosphaeria pertusa]
MTYKLLLATLPIAGSVFYLTYLHLNLSRKVQCQTKPYPQDKTITLPSTIQNRPEKYIIHHERARKSIPTASLGTYSKPETLTLLLRHTMATFSRQPPAWGIWYLIKDAKDRGTFDSAYIRSLQFAPGDRVCGVYVVSSRDAERVTLALDAPESYSGPLVEGMLVVEVKEEGSETTFINHTVMWREKGKGRAGALESAGGRWMHGLMVRRLVESGVQRLLAELGDKKGL